MSSSSDLNGLGNKRWAGDAPEHKVTVVLGAQWGDEGKGKVVDMLASDADVVCRCQVRNCFSSKMFKKFIKFTSLFIKETGVVKICS